MRFLRTSSCAWAALLVASCLLAVQTVHAADGGREKELIAVLAGGSPEADKAIACKDLAVHGSAAAVPALAALLDNPRLSSWSRIALEAIPDPACDAALRNAAGKLSGSLLVGMINSLGVRRDAAAVDLLSKKLADADASVASAAAVALGKIGNAQAAGALRAAITTAKASLRSAVAEGLVLCAERALAEGKNSDAVAIYDLVRAADVPKPMVRAAVRGAILARGAAGVPLLVEQLRSPDRGFFRLGLSTARELPGGAVDAAIVNELKAAPADRGAVLIDVLADRGNPEVIPTLVQVATAGPKEMRRSAFTALGRLGRAEHVSTLLAGAKESDPDLSATAIAAIAALRDPGVDEIIRARFKEAQGGEKPMLLAIVGARRIDMVPQVIELAKSDDTKVRWAALAALGQTVDLARLPVLITAAMSPRSAEESAVAMKALRAAAVRMPDRDACVEKLLAETSGGSIDTRVEIIEIIGQMGGAKALAAAAAAAKQSDAKIQDAGTRVLGAWPTPDAGPVLLELSKTLPDGKFRTRAFRGYLRVARQLGGTPPEKAAMCRKAYEAARGVEDKTYVLEAIASIPVKESIALAVEAGQSPELKEAARTAVKAILDKTGDTIPGAWEMAAKLGIETPAAPAKAPSR